MPEEQKSISRMTAVAEATLMFEENKARLLAERRMGVSILISEICLKRETRLRVYVGENI